MPARRSPRRRAWRGSALSGAFIRAAAQVVAAALRWLRRSKAREATGLAATFVVAVAAGLFISAAVTSGNEGGFADTGRSLSGIDLPSGATSSKDFAVRRATTRKAGANRSTIATVRRRRVRIFTRPRLRARSKIIRQRVENGQRIPLTFLVKRRRRNWLQVHLPTRPNLSTAWVREVDVDLTTTSYKIVVALERHTLSLLKDNKLLFRTKIAKGKSISPTPVGTYYVTDLIRAKDPKGFYGPFALGLSGHSPVYTSFAGGNGQIGVHGTNQPEALGKDASAGCIRVGNRAIIALAKRVPLGTPVVIRR